MTRPAKLKRAASPSRTSKRLGFPGRTVLLCLPDEDECSGRSSRFVAIGDFPIDFATIVTDVGNERCVVQFLHEERMLAPNLFEFLYLLVEGKFDFVK